MKERENKDHLKFLQHKSCFKIFRKRKSVKCSSPQLNTFLEQKPITYIDDTTAPIGDLNFPSVTICNINQVEHYKKTVA